MRAVAVGAARYADRMVDNPPGANPHRPTAAVAPAPGHGGLPKTTSWPNWLRYLLLAGTVLLIAACALYMAYELGVNLGVEALLVGTAAAVLPVPLLIGAFLWLDRYEPEPVRYLAFCFAWGAFVSTAASLTVNTFWAGVFEEMGLPDALTAVLVAPFIEELTKTLGPILLLVLRRREWSGIIDGIVYCGISAVGFAMVENILYLGGHGYAAGTSEYGPATGATMLFGIFIVRILLFGFAHPLFTALAGIGLGLAARSARRRVQILAPLAGLILAMMLHGLWNLLPSLVSATGETLVMVYGYLAVIFPIFFAMVGLAMWLRGWEGRLTERTLPGYVRAGWFAPPEVAALGSLGRRHAARSWARRVGGEPARAAMRDFQFAATRLALLRDRMQRGLDTSAADRERSSREEQQLLTAITGYRPYFTARDPQTPAARWDGLHYHLKLPDGSVRQVPAADEPVVPIPVLLAPPAYGPPVYGSPTYGLPAAGSPGYGRPSPGALPDHPQLGSQPGGYGPGVPPLPGSGGPGYPPPGYGPPAYGPPVYGPPGHGPAGYGPAGPTPPAGAPTSVPPPPPPPPPANP